MSGPGRQKVSLARDRLILRGLETVSLLRPVAAN